MRMQIYLRDDLAKVLNELAWQENRYPKQQAEWLLQKALEQVITQGPPQAVVAEEGVNVEGGGHATDSDRDCTGTLAAAENHRGLPVP